MTNDQPYGDPSAARRWRGPRPLAGALERLRGAATPPTLLAAVQQQWQSVAGAEVAAQCEPASEHDGTVFLSCSSAVWAAELELMSGELLERLNSALPEGPKVTELRFITRPK